MSFKKFIKACRKYKFSYVLNTYCNMTLMIRPHNTFVNINLENKDWNYRKLFKDAVKEMKLYRQKH